MTGHAVHFINDKLVSKDQLVPDDKPVINDRFVVMICGPTACGKSETALLLAQSIGGEIISADSMQVYRGMDIGTAKMPAENRRGIPHHLIDICDPTERFSVADYQALAYEAVRAILDRGRWPIVCGGTGQYVSALVDGLAFSPIPADEGFRRRLESEADQEGLNKLYERLAGRDPEAAARISSNDRKRIIRALEMLEHSNLPQRAHLIKSRQAAPPFSFRLFGISFDRPLLYERINRRVQDMIGQGLEQEVRALLAQSLPAGSTCLQAIGYKEMIPFLEGRASLDDTIAVISQATRRYAKRQLTWFRHMSGMNWLINQTPEENCEKILEFLRNIR